MREYIEKSSCRTQNLKMDHINVGQEVGDIYVGLVYTQLESRVIEMFS